MAFLIVMPGHKVSNWVSKLEKEAPGLDIRIWPDVGKAEEIEFALTWHHPPGEFLKFKNLKCIASMGAGVDHIFRDPDLPAGVPITRIIDPSMSQFMSEYVVMMILNYCRHFNRYRLQQTERKWAVKIPVLANRIKVGVMGLGQLGKDAAQKLVSLGFKVTGWSRTPKALDNVTAFAGDDQFDKFLSQADILVCLLPLTPLTRNILNRETFGKLPPGAYIINTARGEHLVEQDLIDALDSGQLSGACLDVFRTEPLPGDHPFWHHPQLIVTPHISSLTHPGAVAPQIIENYRRAMSRSPLLHQVDTDRGY